MDLGAAQSQPIGQGKDQNNASSTSSDTVSGGTTDGGTTSGGASYGEKAAEAVSDLLDAYCDREAECIAGCCFGSECSCASEERRAVCPTLARQWFAGYVDRNGPSCEATLTDWVACIANSNCADVKAFMRAEPDGVVPGTPCHDEYHALTCDDFEPVEADYVVD